MARGCSHSIGTARGRSPFRLCGTSARSACPSRRKRRQAASTTSASMLSAGTSGRSFHRVSRITSISSCISAPSTTKPACGSMMRSWPSTTAAIRLSRSTSPACSSPDRRTSSPCGPMTIRTISPNLAASRTGSSSRTRSGTGARLAFGRQSGLKSCRLPALRSCGANHHWSAGKSISRRSFGDLPLPARPWRSRSPPATRFWRKIFTLASGAPPIARFDFPILVSMIPATTSFGTRRTRVSSTSTCPCAMPRERSSTRSGATPRFARSASKATGSY